MAKCNIKLFPLITVCNLNDYCALYRQLSHDGLNTHLLILQTTNPKPHITDCVQCDDPVHTYFALNLLDIPSIFFSHVI